MALGNPDFDAILSTTLKKYTPKLEDNIFSHVTLLHWLREADHIQKVDGGESIVEPLLYATNSTAGSYAGYDNILTTPQEGITAAVYPWRQYGVTVAISGAEEAKNSGESAVINLLKAKVDQAEMSAIDAMNVMFYADGTGNSSKDWLGLEAIVDTDNTLGGIDRSSSDNAWWRANVTALGGALTTAAAETLYNDCSKGKITPNFGLTTQALWEKYLGLLTPQQRFEDPKTAEAGFRNLTIHGSPLMWDEDCGSGIFYLLNSKFLKLKVHSKVWFQNLGFERPHGQHARYAPIVSMGNLVTNNSRFLGKLTGAT